MCDISSQQILVGKIDCRQGLRESKEILPTWEPGYLTVPRVNPEIWANMNHTDKQADLKQNIVSKVGSIVAKCMDTLLRACSKEMNVDKLIGSHMVALALLGHV